MSTATEALRYLGIREPDREWTEKAEAMLAFLREKCPPRFHWRLFPLARGENSLMLDGGPALSGGMAEKMLRDCTHAAVLVCTLGTAFDRLISTEQARDMARAALMDACASALVEEGCDAAERDMKAHLPGRCLTDRFSPGYGDLLTPMKSVTALIGVADTPQPARVRGCAFCALRGKCDFQRPCASGM